MPATLQSGLVDLAHDAYAFQLLGNPEQARREFEADKLPRRGDNIRALMLAHAFSGVQRHFTIKSMDQEYPQESESDARYLVPEFGRAFALTYRSLGYLGLLPTVAPTERRYFQGNIDAARPRRPYREAAELPDSAGWVEFQK